MGFTGNRWGLLLSVVLLGAAARAANGGNSKITVLVNDGAQVAPAILWQAEQETTRIFRKAGIEIAWVNCHVDAEPDECAQSLGANQFVVHTEPESTPTSIWNESNGLIGNLMPTWLSCWGEFPPTSSDTCCSEPTRTRMWAS